MIDDVIHYVDFEVINEREKILAIIQTNLQKTVNFTNQHTSAIAQYRGPGASINGSIRVMKGSKGSSWKKTIEDLDGALAISSLEKTIRVYRGMSGNGQRVLSELKIGEIFSDPAFLSTSLNPVVAMNFAGAFLCANNQVNKRIMRITLPKGSNAIHACNSGEYEVILPRGLKLRLERILESTSYFINHSHGPHYVDIYDFIPILEDEVVE